MENFVEIRVKEESVGSGSEAEKKSVAFSVFQGREAGPKKGGKEGAGIFDPRGLLSSRSEEDPLRSFGEE